MSLDTYHAAMEDWIASDLGSPTFSVTWGGSDHDVNVVYEFEHVKPADAPAVRFSVSHAASTEGSPALSDETGAMICQVFIDAGTSHRFAKKIAGDIATAAKRGSFTTKGTWGAPVPQGPASIEPEGLYQFNLRIPFWYLEAA